MGLNLTVLSHYKSEFLLAMKLLESAGEEAVGNTSLRQIEFTLPVAVCAWCKPGTVGGTMSIVSHGICLRHLKKMRLKLEKHRRKAVEASHSH
jgi:hypothetical protein